MGKTVILKINNVPRYTGRVLVNTDERGVPLERFWRKRLADAETDNCVEIVRPKRKRNNDNSTSA